MATRVYLALLASVFFVHDTVPVYAFPSIWRVYGISDGLPGGSVSAVAVDPGGYVWVGSGGVEQDQPGGLTILNHAGEMTPPYGTSDGLSSTVVRAIAFEPIAPEHYSDFSYGRVWIATNRGLTVLDRKGVFTRLTARKTPLPGNNIVTVYIDSGNTKWVSVRGRGVSCVDTEFNWHRYTTADGLCSNRILSICEDGRGNMWFASKANGVSRLDREGAWTHFSSANSGLISNAVRAVVSEKPNRVWFVTSSGVSVFDGRNWMSYTSRNSPLGSFSATSMAVDPSGNKWVGTREGGLFKLDGFGIWSHYHTDNTMLPNNTIRALSVDGQGTVWVATPTGLCSIGSALRQQARSDWNITGDGGEGQESFEHALIWEAAESDDNGTRVTFALPSFPYGGRSWFYAVLWPENGGGLASMDYHITGRRDGTVGLVMGGALARVRFLLSGGFVSQLQPGDMAPRHGAPFPPQIPEELRQWAGPGRFLPSDSPGMTQLARSLIRPESEGDMYKTVRDIVYSRLVQHMGFTPQRVRHAGDNETDPDAGIVPPPSSVQRLLRYGKGDSHSKARLVCTLIRAAGIPARMVMSVGGHAWVEAWIAGAGWVPVEVSYPVYDYVRPARTQVPKAFLPGELALASISGGDDDMGRVVREPPGEIRCAAVDPQGLDGHQSLQSAGLFVMTIATLDESVGHARLPLGDNIFAVARQRRDALVLVFQNGDGSLIQQERLALNGLAQAVNVQDRLVWKFIPRKIGELLVIENIACGSLPDLPSPELLPGFGLGEPESVWGPRTEVPKQQ